jgi:hypothetical protein
MIIIITPEELRIAKKKLKELMKNDKCKIASEAGQRGNEGISPSNSPIMERS